jgi:hypothetical protein
VSTVPYSSCTLSGVSFPGLGLRFGSTKIKDDPSIGLRRAHQRCCELIAPALLLSLPTSSQKALSHTNRLAVEGYPLEWLEGCFWFWLTRFAAAMWQIWKVKSENSCHTILLHVSTAPHSSCAFFGARFSGEGLRFGSTKIKDDPWNPLG